ncbi:ZmpA/ZmpB/ZmpC family metallo-endopeptidase-related protein [Saccharospirillum mangrovi]|uniref:ZmpA/ZmpB/ZmpC family metallo-endopeptidase-related protein n=1 Tax=Saccharospirillum mangrovi TaxID=2161747 RepID=UPI0013009212|nr:ZmpA/ZmpB/ZmpC family metallo-endopeptidase-related protein [Saccharospirillum mangrovi]
MRGLINLGFFVALSALGLTGCNSENGGSGGGNAGPSVQTEPFFCAGGICSLARGVALNEEYATTVQDELISGNVILKAANDSELMLTHAIEWNSSHSLTLQANNDIHIQGGITASAGQLIIDNPGHQYDLRKPVNLSAGPNLRVNGESYTVITELGAPGSTTATDLQGMNGNLTANYALGADIDAAATSSWNGGEGFSPIALEDSVQGAFKGDFTGLGHIIRNFQIERTTSTNVGLFSVLNGSTIRDVALRDTTITGKDFVGAVAGSVTGQSQISGSCVVGGTIEALNNAAGGLVGEQSASLTITDSCVVRIRVSREDYAGGFIGNQNAGATIIRQSYFAGYFSGNGSNSNNTGIYIGAFAVQPTISESLYYLQSGTIPGGSPSGSTQLVSSQLSQLAPYENANWDISDDPDQHSLWFLNVPLNPYLLPMLRVFDINMNEYNYDA